METSSRSLPRFTASRRVSAVPEGESSFEVWWLRLLVGLAELLIGFWAAGQITDHYTVAGVHDWHTIWLLPAGLIVGPGGVGPEKY